MASKIEDIDSQYSLAAIAKVDKVEHAIKMEKVREQQRKAHKEKQLALQTEIDRRSKIFEMQRLKNLFAAQRQRDMALSKRFKTMEDVNAGYMQYDPD